MTTNVFTAVKEGEGIMATIDKHFMLTEEICSILRQRDKNRFPLERDFVSEAVKSYGEHLLLEQILKELREFRTWMEGKTGPVKWK